jgi:Fe-S-cluster containining protein
MWPVPVTTADYHRINELSRSLGGDAGGFQAAPSFRPLTSAEERHAAFSHTLEKRADGKCQFLSEDNRCQLHTAAGQDVKPSMCRLFPFTFTETPDGAFSSLSFASSSVLYNQGELLCEQRPLVEDMWRLYNRLFTMIRPSWDHLQYIDGVPISWTDFRALDEEMLAVLHSPTATVQTVDSGAQPGEPSGERASERPVEQRLLDVSKYLVSRLPVGADSERMPPLEARPEIIDQLLLKSLNSLYLPPDVFRSSEFALNARRLLESIVQAPDVVTIDHAGQERRFQEAASIQLGRLPAGIENLLHRFVYCRIFSKQYLGPTMGYLSLLAGLHHLLLIVVMLKLRMKLEVCQGNPLTFEYAAELVRSTERRLTQLSFPRDSVAVLEVLLTSPSRVERLASLVG